MPRLRIALGGIRLFEIGIIGKKVLAESVRDRLVTRFAEQHSVSFVREWIVGRFGRCSGVKVFVRQLKPAFALRNQQGSIVVQGCVEAAHIQLFNSRCGRMKRKTAKRADFRTRRKKKAFMRAMDPGFS